MRSDEGQTMGMAANVQFRSAMGSPQEVTMKTLACKDLGVDCAYVARGKTVDDVLKKATAHGKKDHGITKVTKDYL
ncbi:MAG TPA: DUF1059 domain-containing protein, partial [Nitrospirota bacterium]|nr:DUF1059 domain-containing protein [Nitrospirota bacterium]